MTTTPPAPKPPHPLALAIREFLDTHATTLDLASMVKVLRAEGHIPSGIKRGDEFVMYLTEWYNMLFGLATPSDRARPR